MNTTRFFDLNEAAQVAGLEECSLRKAIERGEILAHKFGGKNFLSTSEVSLMLWQKAPTKAPEFDAKFGVTYNDADLQ